MNTSSPSSPASPVRPNSPGPTKLPKFLRSERRDRSKSTTETSGIPPPALSAPSTSLSSSVDSKHRTLTKKTSRLFGSRSVNSGKAVSEPGVVSEQADVGEPPVIVEPPSNSRLRTARPRQSTSTDVENLSSSVSSVRGFNEFSSRLSGWFSHLGGSSTDLSLPNILSQSTLSASQVLAGSPKTKQPNALLIAARTGKGHLDKAMRYLLDSDAQPDKSTDPIWVMGVQHPGYEPPPLPPSPQPQISPVPIPGSSKRAHKRESTDVRRSPSSYRPPSTFITQHANTSNQSISSTSGLSSAGGPSSSAAKYANSWPQAFYADFTSRIWCSYRSSFAPIRDTSLAALEPILSSAQTSISSIAEVVASPSKSKWSWALPEKGWTSDAGWGCMLRTGQSLLANALIHLHLSREWRRPQQPMFTPEYAMYVRILTWFLDSASSQCPFGVHRMALAGKELGKEVGSWFGPSTAAGAIRRLVHEFPEAGLGVSVASDGVLYQTEVYLASHLGHVTLAPGALPKAHTHSSKKTKWGDKAVLLLIGIRLGIDGVHPIYYESVKQLFTFPQSVGIAGGRPSSSYYFVGTQTDNLFYLDPHHTRPTIPLRPPPPNTPSVVGTEDYTDDGHSTSHSSVHHFRRGGQITPDTSDRESRHRKPISPTSTGSIRSGSSISRARGLPGSPVVPRKKERSSLSLSPSPPPVPPAPGSTIPGNAGYGSAVPMDAISTHYATAYSPMELKTFHCERVRKMPLSSLDPSMLLGFMCKDEADWKDFRERVSKLPKAIFAIQDEPPTWPDDTDDLDIESASEPDIDSSVVGDSEDTFLDSPDAQGVEKKDFAADEQEIEVEGNDEGEYDPVTPVGGYTRKDTLRPGAAGTGVAKAPGTLPVPVQRKGSGIRDQQHDSDDDEDDDEEWIDPIEPPLPTKSAPNGNNAVGLSPPKEISLRSSTRSSAFREQATTKDGKSSVTSSPVGSLKVRNTSSGIRSSHKGSESTGGEVPFPSAASGPSLISSTTQRQVAFPETNPVTGTSPPRDVDTSSESGGGGNWSSAVGHSVLVPPFARRERKTTVRKATSGGGSKHNRSPGSTSKSASPGHVGATMGHNASSSTSSAGASTSTNNSQSSKGRSTWKDSEGDDF